MALRIEIPGRDPLELEHLLLDQNGTFCDRGELIPGVAERLRPLSERLAVHVLSADTFGTLAVLGPKLGVEHHRVSAGVEKRAFMERLGPTSCVTIGNGRNDVAMSKAAGLALAVIGPEGASGELLRVADVVCRSVLEAFDLLLDPRVLVATLRA